MHSLCCGHGQLAASNFKGFHLTKSVRKKFLERESEALKAAILSHSPVGEPTIGNAEADMMIRQYALGLM